MTVINLTPHTLNIHLSDNPNDVDVVPPSGAVARVSTQRCQTGTVDGIPVYTVFYGEIIGLPPQQSEDIYIVSGMVASALPREDVYSPGELIRNDQGQPVGCRGLTASC